MRLLATEKEKNIRAEKLSETNRGRNGDISRGIRDSEKKKNKKRRREKNEREREESGKQEEEKRYGRSVQRERGEKPNEIKHQGGSLLLYRAVNEK